VGPVGRIVGILALLNLNVCSSAVSFPVNSVVSSAVSFPPVRAAKSDPYSCRYCIVVESKLSLSLTVVGMGSGLGVVSEIPMGSAVVSSPISS